jgi:hypothetical protein
MSSKFKNSLLQKIEDFILSEGGTVEVSKYRGAEILKAQFYTIAPEEGLSCLHPKKNERHNLFGKVNMTLYVDSDDTIVLENNEDKGLIYSSLIATMYDFTRVMEINNAHVKKS